LGKIKAVADGTLIEAWASLKSSKPKGKGPNAKRDEPADTSRNPMESRTGLCVAANLEPADGKAERRGLLGLLKDLRKLKIKPHIAMIESRKTPGLDRRTTRSVGCAISQRVRP